jgi:hypothetical protein
LGVDQSAWIASLGRERCGPRSLAIDRGDIWQYAVPRAPTFRSQQIPLEPMERAKNNFQL